MRIRSRRPDFAGTENCDERSGCLQEVEQNLVRNTHGQCKNQAKHPHAQVLTTNTARVASKAALFMQTSNRSMGQFAKESLGEIPACTASPSRAGGGTWKISIYSVLPDTELKETLVTGPALLPSPVMSQLRASSSGHKSLG